MLSSFGFVLDREYNNTASCRTNVLYYKSSTVSDIACCSGSPLFPSLGSGRWVLSYSRTFTMHLKDHYCPKADFAFS